MKRAEKIAKVVFALIMGAALVNLIFCCRSIDRSTKSINESVKSIEESVKSIEESTKSIEESVKSIEESVKTIEENNSFNASPEPADAMPYPIIDTAVFTPPLANEETHIDPETGELKTYRIVTGKSSSRLVYGSNLPGIGVCDLSDGRRLVAPFNFPDLDDAYVKKLVEELAENGIKAEIMSYDARLAGWPIEIHFHGPDEVSNRDISVIAYNVAAKMAGIPPYDFAE